MCPLSPGGGCQYLSPGLKCAGAEEHSGPDPLLLPLPHEPGKKKQLCDWGQVKAVGCVSQRSPFQTQFRKNLKIPWRYIMWGGMLVIAYCWWCVCVRAYVQVTMMRLLSLALWWLTAELLVKSFTSKYCVWDSFLTPAFCVCLLVWNHIYLYTYILFVCA